ncbi:hypothetical protein KKA50_00370 [Patescibacteria group bacterium]|nr:hypothetical protein [Patescibacteria group bacterium]
MLILVEDVVGVVEQIVPLIGSHLSYVARESEEDDFEMLASTEIPLNIQVNKDFLPMAKEEIEDLKIDLPSSFGISSNNCYAIFIGWQNTVCNMITSAIAVWMLENNTLPSIRITRSLPSEQYYKARYEYLGTINELDSFTFTAEFEGAIPINFVKDDEQDFLKWEFYGPEARGLQKFLRKTLGIMPSKDHTYDGVPNLLLTFNT